MTPERRKQIRQAAALRCASQLNATVTEDGYDSRTMDDWPDAGEREEFGTRITRIIRRLYREAGRP